MFEAGFQMQNDNISDAFDDPDQEFIENVTNVLDCMKLKFLHQPNMDGSQQTMNWLLIG